MASGRIYMYPNYRGVNDLKSNINQKIVKPQRYTIEQFMMTESLLNVSISHDDQTILYGSDKSGIYNAHAIDVNGKVSQQLTFSKDNLILPITYFPDSKNRFLYESDQGGNEITHIYLQDENGHVTDLTPDNNEKAFFYKWSDDQTSFFYESNKRDERFMDLYEMDNKTWNSKMLFQNEDGFEIRNISPDKKYIALHKPITSNNSDMYVYSKEKGIEHLSPHDDDVQFIPLAFTKEATDLYFLTDENHEFLYLKRINLETREVETVAKEEWDIVLAKFSPQFNYLLYAINNNGSVEIKVVDTTTFEPIDMNDFPSGQISSISISHSEKLMAFLLNSSHSPANLYVYHFESKEIHCLTDTLNSEINKDDLVEAGVIHYPSFDGLSIPAIYYQPHLYENKKVPALVFVHGGPGGQSMVDYNPLFQYLANQGYAILAVNNRGSSGYGKTFFKAADKKHGEVDLADCIEGKKFLKETGKIDEDRIGIIGGSYGGFMVLAALAFEPDSFKIGVDIFGVSNWERTLKEIPAWWESMRDVLYKKIGDPYQETDYIRSISPLFHAKNITKPLIVLQGANDPRVLKVESDEIVEAVRENSVPVEYIVFDDEGHGFTKRKNQIEGYEAVKEFLDHYL